VESRSTTYCEACGRRLLAQWKAWPHKTAVPILPALIDGACAECGSSNELSSERIHWENVHGPYNTGLPDNWLLQIDTGNESWGRPYYSELACPRCGGRTIVSEMKFTTGRGELMHNCPVCGVLRLKKSGPTS